MEIFNHGLNILQATSDLSTVGSRIKYYRLLNNLTQDELANKTSLDRITIIGYENNTLEQSLESLNKIANALNIDPSLLYDDYLKFISGDYNKKIKQFRKDLNLTQKRLADLC